ncbi:hypothetical protein SAMN04487926_12142 [Paraburkholderia steynii]|uniref:Uncharacterized protein n=1 Tax=Paraburkholderia steynii TaxID=1245441 RepID=A0A7Z7BBY6_9BURK|nr:hypothetical protein [Paraburkholderia steynii]SDI65027.1 hypothetical protein SAMN04487926_12142 [Paraburkholderia steynii]
MRLLVRMRLSESRADSYATFECMVIRLSGPLTKPKRGGAFLHAEVILPVQYRRLALAKDWTDEGTYQVEVPLQFNRKSLAPFLASGDGVWIF